MNASMNAPLKAGRRSGQALTEFVFLMPIMFLIIFSIVQIIVIAECHQRTQMSTWFAMRSQTYDGSHSFVTEEEVREAIDKDMFAKDDEIIVEAGRSLLSYEAEVKCDTPFLFRRVRWAALQSVFSDVESDGKIEVSSKNQMLKDFLNW